MDEEAGAALLFVRLLNMPPAGAAAGVEEDAGAFEPKMLEPPDVAVLLVGVDEDVAALEPKSPEDGVGALLPAVENRFPDELGAEEAAPAFPNREVAGLAAPPPLNSPVPPDCVVAGAVF